MPDIKHLFSQKQNNKPENRFAAGTLVVFLLFLFELVAFGILYVSERSTAFLYMLAPLSVIIIGGSILVYRTHADRSFFYAAFILLTYGTIIQCMLLEEDTPPMNLFTFYWIAIAAALIGGFLYKRLPLLASPRFVMVLIVLSILMYAATLVLGTAGAGGVTNWIQIGPITFQPSEFIKGMYVLILAGLLGTKEEPGVRRILSATLVTLMNLAFLILQGEFGTILLILATFVLMIFLFVPDIKYFLLIVFAGIASGGAGVLLFSLIYKIGGSNFLVRQVQKIVNRFAPWLYLNFGKNPTGMSAEQYQNANYQVLQGRKALLNSHLFGSSTRTPIPNLTNDSVFPALTERCGTAVAFMICVLFAILLVRGTRIFFHGSDRFHQAVAAGLIFQIVLQSYIIIGGSIGLLPLTGITLPLISSGGSSLVATFLYLSVILSISTGNLWDGRRDYTPYAINLQKKSSAHVERLSRLRNRSRRQRVRRDVR